MLSLALDQPVKLAQLLQVLVESEQTAGQLPRTLLDLSRALDHLLVQQLVAIYIVGHPQAELSRRGRWLDLRQTVSRLVLI